MVADGFVHPATWTWTPTGENGKHVSRADRRRANALENNRPAAHAIGSAIAARILAELRPRGLQGRGGARSLRQDSASTPDEAPPPSADRSDWERGFQSLESTLSDVLEVLRSGASSIPQILPTQASSRLGLMHQPENRVVDSKVQGLSTPATINSHLESWRSPHQPLWKGAQAVAPHYLEFCDCQPLPLFRRDGFLDSLSRRSEEVLIAIIGMAARFSDHSTGESQEYCKEVQASIAKKVIGGCFELGTLQAMCLLALLHFYA
ncbi:hypothetical protein G7046_g6323 [Stylonectria norvegica]|nr:hypothetical protein G7046_g6323 [Stylonectria norvegica]